MNKYFMVIPFVVCLLTIGAFSHGEQHIETINKISRLLENSMHNYKQQNIKQFTIISFDITQIDLPNLKKTKSKNVSTILQVRANGVPEVWISTPKEGSSIGGSNIGIPGQLQAIDFDGDGKIDYLDYTIKDIKNKSSTTIYDFDMDGQADQRFHLSDTGNKKYTFLEIWHLDKWFRVIRKNNNNGILINGDFIKVKNGEHGQYSVDTSHNKKINTDNNISGQKPAH